MFQEFLAVQTVFLGKYLNPVGFFVGMQEWVLGDKKYAKVSASHR